MSQIGKAELKAQQDAQFTQFLHERGLEIEERFNRGRNRSAMDIAARQQLFTEKIEDVFERCLAKRYQPGKLYIPKATVRPELALNVNMSDLHYGAALDSREVPLQYGHVEEARRTAAIAAWVAGHVKDPKRRRETKLILNWIGDIIQNQLHDLRDGDPLTEQFAASVHLLTQFLVYLAGAGYHSIVVNCTPGNHGRNTARHKDRATNQKWDAIETMIYYAVKTAVGHIPTITFNLPYRPFVTYDVFGHHIFATHGDTVLKPGYPNQTINVGDVRKQVNEINGRREGDEKYRVFIVGHVHVASCTKLPNGVYFMSNGCLIPSDAYAQSIGIMETATCQTMFESTPDHAVGFRCEIDVDERTDKDASLDKIIVPFKSL